ncbi:hypothetical protein VTH06DRAFT_5380 [Thermothelomyces fergusii]
MRPPIQCLPLRPRVFEKACRQCTHRASRDSSAAAGAACTSRFFSRSALPRAPVSPSALPRQRFAAGFFLSNALLSRANGTSAASQPTNGAGPAVSASFAASVATTTNANTDAPTDVQPLLPHRRRQAARRDALRQQQQEQDQQDRQQQQQQQRQQGEDGGLEAPGKQPSLNSMSASLPPDASARLADSAARAPADSLRRTLSVLLSLSKPRLTVLVVLSAMVPYALYPVPAFLSPTALAASTPSCRRSRSCS